MLETCHLASLLHPSTFNTDWIWRWVICLTSFRLYFCASPDGNRWQQYSPTSIRRTYLTYSWDHPVVCRPPPSWLIPVTPLESKNGMGFYISLPLPPFPTCSPADPKPICSPFLSHLKTTCESWERTSWCDLRQNGPDYSLCSAILSGAPLIISSDASTNAAKSSCFAWSISLGTILWKGAGIMSSPVEDSYPGHAKAFSIFSALQFLLHYITYFPLVFPLCSPIKVICDNQGTIQRIEKMRNSPFISAWMTTTDDFDIYQAIFQTDKQLYPLTFSYFHIKGYQDKFWPFHQLSPDAQLNVECDWHAGSLLPKLLRLHKPVHLQLPLTSANLYIHGQLIVRDFQYQLWYAACFPDYWLYLCQKFQWRSEDSEEVNWLAFSFAIRQFQANDQRQLHKFLHDWLPLNAAIYMSKPIEEQMCPSCHCHKEDFWHFLECPHPTPVAAFNKLRSSLQSLHQKYSADLHLFQLLWEGLYLSDIPFPLMNSYRSILLVTKTFSPSKSLLAGISCIMDILLSPGQRQSQYLAMVLLMGQFSTLKLSGSFGSIFLIFGNFATQTFILPNFSISLRIS